MSIINNLGGSQIIHFNNFQNPVRRANTLPLYLDNKPEWAVDTKIPETAAPAPEIKKSRWKLFTDFVGNTTKKVSAVFNKVKNSAFYGIATLAKKVTLTALNIILDVAKIVVFIHKQFQGAGKASGTWDKFKKSGFNKFLKALKLADIVKAPFIVYNLGKHSYQLFTAAKEKKKEEAVDAGGEIVKDVGEAFRVTESFARGLANVGAVALKAIAWTVPVMIVGSVISAVSLAFSAKGIYDTYSLKRHMYKEIGGKKKKKEQYSLEDLNTTVGLLEAKSAKLLAKYFDVSDGAEFLEQVKKVQEYAAKEMERISRLPDEANAASEGEDETSKLLGKQEQMEAVAKKVDTVMRALQKKLSGRIASLGMTIGSDILNIVGTGVMFSPLPIIATGFFAGSAIVSVGQMAHDFWQDKRLEKALKLDENPVKEEAQPETGDETASEARLEPKPAYDDNDAMNERYPFLDTDSEMAVNLKLRARSLAISTQRAS